MVEPDRRLQRLGAVAQRGLEIDQPADFMRSCTPWRCWRCRRIDQRVGAPVVGILVGRCGMDHDLGLEIARTGDRRAQPSTMVSSISLSLALPAEVVAPAGGEIIDRKHVVAALGQHVDDRRTDLTGAAGNKHFHSNRLSRLRWAAVERFYELGLNVEFPPRGHGTSGARFQVKAGPRSCAKTARPGRNSPARHPR